MSHELGTLQLGRPACLSVLDSDLSVLQNEALSRNLRDLSFDLSESLTFAATNIDNERRIQGNMVGVLGDPLERVDADNWQHLIECLHADIEVNETLTVDGIPKVFLRYSPAESMRLVGGFQGLFASISAEVFGKLGVGNHALIKPVEVKKQLAPDL